GEEESRQRVRVVVIGEEEPRIGTKSVGVEKAAGSEDRKRVGRALTLALAPDLTQARLAAAVAAQRMSDLPVRRQPQGDSRGERAGRRDDVDVAAGPAGDAEDLVDRKPRHPVARALETGEPLFLDGGDEPIVVKGGGR